VECKVPVLRKRVVNHGTLTRLYIPPPARPVQSGPLQVPFPP
jgi:hypothetical protein